MKKEERKKTDAFFVGVFVGGLGIILLLAGLKFYLADGQQVMEEGFHDEVSKITLDEFEEITECVRYGQTGVTLWEKTSECVVWNLLENGTWIDEHQLREIRRVLNDDLLDCYNEVPNADYYDWCLLENPNIHPVRFEKKCVHYPVQETECVEWKRVGWRMMGR